MGKANDYNTKQAAFSARVDRMDVDALLDLQRRYKARLIAVDGRMRRLNRILLGEAARRVAVDLDVAGEEMVKLRRERVLLRGGLGDDRGGYLGCLSWALRSASSSEVAAEWAQLCVPVFLCGDPRGLWRVQRVNASGVYLVDVLGHVLWASMDNGRINGRRLCLDIPGTLRAYEEHKRSL